MVGATIGRPLQNDKISPYNRSAYPIPLCQEVFCGAFFQKSDKTHPPHPSHPSHSLRPTVIHQFTTTFFHIFHRFSTGLNFPQFCCDNYSEPHMSYMAKAVQKFSSVYGKLIFPLRHFLSFPQTFDTFALHILPMENRWLRKMNIFKNSFDNFFKMSFMSTFPQSFEPVFRHIQVAFQAFLYSSKPCVTSPVELFHNFRRH